jgi:hypothetical protein
MPAEPDPKDERRHELQGALCELGPSRDEVGSIARQQLALELAKMTIERFMGSAVPCQPYVQAPAGNGAHFIARGSKLAQGALEFVPSLVFGVGLGRHKG